MGSWGEGWREGHAAGCWGSTGLGLRPKRLLCPEESNLGKGFLQALYLQSPVWDLAQSGCLWSTIVLRASRSWHIVSACGVELLASEHPGVFT